MIRNSPQSSIADPLDVDPGHPRHGMSHCQVYGVLVAAFVGHGAECSPKGVKAEIDHARLLTDLGELHRYRVLLDDLFDPIPAPVGSLPHPRIASPRQEHQAIGSANPPELPDSCPPQGASTGYPGLGPDPLNEPTPHMLCP